MANKIMIDQTFLELPTIQKLARLYGDKAVMAYIRMLCFAGRFGDTQEVVSINLFDSEYGIWRTNSESISRAIGVSEKVVGNVLDFLEQSHLLRRYADGIAFYTVIDGYQCIMFDEPEKAVTENDPMV